MNKPPEYPHEYPKSDESVLMATSYTVQTLIHIAERRKGVDAQLCRLALLHAESAVLLRRGLRSVLAMHNLSDLQFAVLVILFSVEPEAVSASGLVEHAGFSRASMTNALDKLESCRLLYRNRDVFDRRVTFVRITAAGQETVDRAINDYLRTAEAAFMELQTADQGVLLSAHRVLLRKLSTIHSKQ